MKDKKEKKINEKYLRPRGFMLEMRSSSSLYLSGAIRVSVCCCECVSFWCRQGGRITVEGKGLFCRSFYGGVVEVSGTITNISFGGVCG